MLICLLLLTLPGIWAGTNLFQNPGFESTGNWECTSCTGSLSSDKRSGSHSYKVTERKAEWAGVSQTVPITGGHYYYFKIWFKILNTANGNWYESAKAMVDILHDTGNHDYKQIGEIKFVFPDRWHLVGGDLYISTNVKSVRFYIQIPEASVSYVVDDADMDQVEYLSNFANDADYRIDEFRKTNVDVSVTGTADPSGLQIEFQQLKSEFGWGSAVKARTIVDDNYKAYQNFFYDTFEWAVLENSMKWPSIENTKGYHNYDLPLQAMYALQEKGILLRGHNLFWGLPYVPEWQKTMSGVELRPELSKHIQGMMAHFKGKFKHWDVNNENVHLHFYEDKLHDEWITHWMFKETKKEDPSALCFLNEYDIVAKSQSTMAYADQILWFKASGVPVGGIGVQAHFGSYVDVSIVKRRLDEIAALGLPIWITELDVSESDEQKKAQKYEDLLRLFFSHPAVHGVLFWGFWDQRHWRPTAAIATGNDVTPNAAGRKVQELLKHTWRTNEYKNLNQGQTIHTRAFKGQYKVLVHHDNKILHTENFTLTGHTNHLRINLSGSGTHPQVDHILVG